jgi:hypothetical protein
VLAPRHGILARHSANAHTYVSIETAAAQDNISFGLFNDICRESARVRRARRKESTQHLDQENAELRQNIKQLQHTLATVNPSLPITAFYHRNPHAAFGDSAAAATHAAAVAAIVAPNRKTRVHGEKMTVEELKQARR